MFLRIIIIILFYFIWCFCQIFSNKLKYVEHENICKHFSDSGDRNRWTWLTRAKITDEIFHDLLHHCLPLPVLELWHFYAGQECWANISKSLKIEGSIIQKLVLNDVFLSEEITENVTECCVNVRYFPTSLEEVVSVSSIKLIKVNDIN